MKRKILASPIKLFQQTILSSWRNSTQIASSSGKVRRPRCVGTARNSLSSAVLHERTVPAADEWRCDFAGPSPLGRIGGGGVSCRVQSGGRRTHKGHP